MQVMFDVALNAVDVVSAASPGIAIVSKNIRAIGNVERRAARMFRGNAAAVAAAAAAATLPALAGLALDDVHHVLIGALAMTANASAVSC
jgi:hypothetical protein